MKIIILIYVRRLLNKDGLGRVPCVSLRAVCMAFCVFRPFLLLTASVLDFLLFVFSNCGCGRRQGKPLP